VALRLLLAGDVDELHGITLVDRVLRLEPAAVDLLREEFSKRRRHAVCIVPSEIWLVTKPEESIH
jgi:hypothetical protein